MRDPSLLHESCVNADMQDWQPHGLALLDNDFLISLIEYKPHGDPALYAYPYLQAFSPSLSGTYVPCGAEYFHPARLLENAGKASKAGSQGEQKASVGVSGVEAGQLKHVHLFPSAGQKSQLLVAIERDSQLCTTLFDIL